MNVDGRLAKIEAMLGLLVERQAVREFYEIEEFARLVGRSCWTCRMWCRSGRIQAKKRSGRGGWVVPHMEWLRYQREGLLPVRQPT